MTTNRLKDYSEQAFKLPMIEVPSLCYIAYDGLFANSFLFASSLALDL